MTLVRYLKVNRRAPLFTLCWQLGFAAVGIGMVLVINTFLNEEADYACMGSAFALAATMVGIFARGNLNGYARFSLALSMGQTRRSYVLCDGLVSLVCGAAALITARCIYLLEKTLYGWLYPGFENEMPLDGFFRLKYLLPILAAAVALELFFSALTLRFGRKVFLAVWLAFCFSFMIIPRALDAHTEGVDSLFARIGGALMAMVTGIPAGGWIAIGIAVLAAMVAFAFSVYRRAEVRF